MTAVPPIGRLLVANRGEIARRVLRTCREMGIGTVAVYADPDAAACHVAEADAAVRLPGERAADTYLNVDALLEAARRTGADAVHPCYGFLAEDAGFARACADAGLVFVGPPADVIAAMGRKLAAKDLAARAGVPVLPGRPVTGTDPAGWQAAAAEVGFPLLVKADAGGGGRGMRRVSGPAELPDAVAAAAREAAAAFGDPAVFLEPLLPGARHVEVQVLGDRHGEVVALFERDCSVQRRHQKLVEECPSPAVDGPLRDRLAAAAVAVARAVGYVGAGTVEFLLDAAGAFTFLEMNTRLQVEHPVTELVTGVDLVRAQILVAEGAPLPPEVRAARLYGHAVEARLYAEDPTRGFAPQTGTLTCIDVPAGPGLRVDSGVAAGSVVTHRFDPLLAKVVAWAPTRAEAVRRLAAALAAARLHGVGTNRDLLVRVLRHPEFLAGAGDTGFLDRHDPADLGRPLAGPEAQAWHAVAATLALVAVRRAADRVWGSLPAGWRNNPSQPQRTGWAGGGRTWQVEYAVGRDGLRVCVDGADLGPVVVHAQRPDLVDLTVAGVRRRYAVALHEGPAEAGWTAWVDSPLGASSFTEVPRFPPPAAAAGTGSLTAPLPGSVVRVAVTAGQEVPAGAVLLVLEAMKMEHAVTSPYAGRVAALHVHEGAQVAAGDPVATLLPPPSRSDHAEVDAAPAAAPDPPAPPGGGAPSRTA